MSVLQRQAKIWWPRKKKQSCENRKCLVLQTDVVSKNTLDLPVEAYAPGGIHNYSVKVCI